MRYVSTAAAHGSPAAAFREILLEGLAPDGGLVPCRREPIREVDAGEPSWRAGASSSYRGAGVRDPAPYVDDIPAADLRALVERTYTARRSAPPDITPVKTLEPGLHLLALSNGPTLAFKDLAMQLLGNLFEYVLGAAGGAAQHPRRDVGRHRLGGRVRDARQARRPRVHALAARQDEPVPDGADVLAAGRRTSSTSPCAACSTTARTSSRRSATTPRSRRATASARSIRSTGRACVAQVVYYFKGYLAVAHERRRAGVVRGAVGQLRQHLRRPHRAADGPADPTG